MFSGGSAALTSISVDLRTFHAPQGKFLLGKKRDLNIPILQGNYLVFSGEKTALEHLEQEISKSLNSFSLQCCYLGSKQPYLLIYLLDERQLKKAAHERHLLPLRNLEKSLLLLESLSSSLNSKETAQKIRTEIDTLKKTLFNKEAALNLDFIKSHWEEITALIQKKYESPQESKSQTANEINFMSPELFIPQDEAYCVFIEDNDIALENSFFEFKSDSAENLIIEVMQKFNTLKHYLLEPGKYLIKGKESGKLEEKGQVELIVEYLNLVKHIGVNALFQFLKATGLFLKIEHPFSTILILALYHWDEELQIAIFLTPSVERSLVVPPPHHDYESKSEDLKALVLPSSVPVPMQTSVAELDKIEPRILSEEEKLKDEYDAAQNEYNKLCNKGEIKLADEKLDVIIKSPVFLVYLSQLLKKTKDGHLVFLGRTTARKGKKADKDIYKIQVFANITMGVLAYLNRGRDPSKRYQLSEFATNAETDKYRVLSLISKTEILASLQKEQKRFNEDFDKHELFEDLFKDIPEIDLTLADIVSPKTQSETFVVVLPQPASNPTNAQQTFGAGAPEQLPPPLAALTLPEAAQPAPALEKEIKGPPGAIANSIPILKIGIESTTYNCIELEQWWSANEQDLTKIGVKNAEQLRCLIGPIDFAANEELLIKSGLDIAFTQLKFSAQRESKSLFVFFDESSQEFEEHKAIAKEFNAFFATTLSAKRKAEVPLQNGTGKRPRTNANGSFLAIDPYTGSGSRDSEFVFLPDRTPAMDVSPEEQQHLTRPSPPTPQVH